MTLAEGGRGRPIFVLHGGGGPFTVAGIAGHLGEAAHTILPTHPGWNGTPRPTGLSTIAELASIYLGYLASEGLRDVLVIGSSLGGWLGTEMVLQDRAGLITGLILIDAVGVEVSGEPIRDFFALDARGVAEYSFHDAARFYVDPASLSPEELAARQANMATMKIVAGDPYMHDPSMLARFDQVQIPVLAIWGESDRIVTPAYGAAFAAAFPQARFETVKEAGHLPQIEKPAETFALIDAFLAARQ
ncbi:MAG: alpha/beta hydrolase [Chloroflexi bacterium 54-19]|nr:MAG: alpha/beta hydrolase [Chloroflexi bacterium 54-19]